MYMQLNITDDYKNRWSEFTFPFRKKKGVTTSTYLPKTTFFLSMFLVFLFQYTLMQPANEN